LCRSLDRYQLTGKIDEDDTEAKNYTDAELIRKCQQAGGSVTLDRLKTMNMVLEGTTSNSDFAFKHRLLNNMMRYSISLNPSAEAYTTHAVNHINSIGSSIVTVD